MKIWFLVLSGVLFSTTGWTQGWTDFVPSPDTRIIFVSSSQGNDSNDGLSRTSPKRTIAAAVPLIRPNSPDWLLLRRGDVFFESINNWTTSGRSIHERQLIGAYGRSDQRPVLRTGNASGFAPNVPISNLAIVGLHFFPHTYTGIGLPSAIRIVNQGANILVEDLFIEKYYQNIVIDVHSGTLQNFQLRRSVIVDAFNTEPGNNRHPQGIYINGSDGAVLSGNLFDHNGWRSDIENAVITQFRHAIYVQQYGNTNFRMNNNIVARGDGAQARAGGRIKQNLFVDTVIALIVRGGLESPPQPSDVRWNVILDGRDFNSDLIRGWGIDQDTTYDSKIRDNIIANNENGSFPIALQINPAYGPVHNVRVERNIIYNWGSPQSSATNFNFLINGGVGSIQNLTVRENHFQSNDGADDLLVRSSASYAHAEVTSLFNRFYSAATNWFDLAGSNDWWAEMNDTTSTIEDMSSVYPDPNRSVERYAQEALGLAPTLDSFLTAARGQSRANWDPRLTSRAVNFYIRGGFGKRGPRF